MASLSGRSATDVFRAARDRLLGPAAELFEWPDVGRRFNWAVDWFDVVAAGRTATGLIVAGSDGTERRLSFGELSTRSNQVARWMAGRGVGRGDPVVLMLGNRVELWESMLAVMKLGAVIVPTTTALGPDDLLERIERSGVRHVVAGGDDLAKVDRAPRSVGRIRVGDGPGGWAPLEEAYSCDATALEHPGTAPSDPLLHYFTSGTTSRPKLVEHTQVSYPVGHLTTMHWLGVAPGDVHLNVSSPGWAKHAWSSFFAPWNAEATVVVLDYERFDATVLLGQLERLGVTTFCAPPTVWRMLVQADLSERPSRLREVVAAGEPLNPEVIEQVRRAWGLTVRDGFGQTETTAVVGNPPAGVVRPGSMGRPLPGCPVVLLDPVGGRPVGPGEDGEICLDLRRRPLNLMTGYRDDDVRTAEVTAGGYYHTGDVAVQDEDGYITYVGRTDDVFKASDYKISPFELESVLLEHPAVMEAAVVPAPDPLRLAVPKAYVTLAPGWAPDGETARAILAHARRRLAPFQRIRRIEFAELPKTVSGKIRRVELRAREEHRAAASGEAAGSPAGGADRADAVSEWTDDQFPDLGDAPAR
ncbi:MAG: AMP-binding protein [Acidimicrobiales bacterium]